MKLTKYISTNILSLVGNVGLFIFLLALWGRGQIAVMSSRYFEENCGIWALAIAGIILLLPIDVLINKISHNKLTITFQIKNKIIRYTYYFLFWLGTACAVLYLSLFIWFVSILARL